MLYKVTPMMPAPEAQKARRVKEPGQPRTRRKTAIYDADGHEVLITLRCLKCKSMKPLAQFGLRKMSDGAIRNQPWCRTCRGSAGTKKKGELAVVEDAPQTVAVAASPVAEEVTAPMAEAQAPAEPVAEPAPEVAPA